MKKIIFLFPLLSMMACNDHKNPTVNDKQLMLDSIRSANYSNEVRQRTIDSMNTITHSTPVPIEDNSNVQVTHHKKHETVHEHNNTNAGTTNTVAQTNTNTTSTVTTTGNSTTQTNSGNTASTPTDKKKKMSNTTKGVLIGAGVGVVTGAATGAATSKDKGKGAVVGGVIGGMIGSGVGYGIGGNKDKKEKEKKDTIK